jgi:hypothetical protein
LGKKTIYGWALSSVPPDGEKIFQPGITGSDSRLKIEILVEVKEDEKFNHSCTIFLT